MSTAWVDPDPVAAAPQRASVTVQTTLYDLIAALNANIAPEDDHLVTAEVIRLLSAGRINRSSH